MEIRTSKTIKRLLKNLKNLAVFSEEEAMNRAMNTVNYVSNGKYPRVYYYYIGVMVDQKYSYRKAKEKGTGVRFYLLPEKGRELVALLRGSRRDEVRPAKFEQTTILPFHNERADSGLEKHFATKRRLSPLLIKEIEKGPIGFGVDAFKSRKRRVNENSMWGEDNTVLADFNYLSFDLEQELLDGVISGDVICPPLNIPLIFWKVPIHLRRGDDKVLYVPGETAHEFWLAAHNSPDTFHHIEEMPVRVQQVSLYQTGIRDVEELSFGQMRKSSKGRVYDVGTRDTKAPDDEDVDPSLDRIMGVDEVI